MKKKKIMEKEMFWGCVAFDIGWLLFIVLIWADTGMESEMEMLISAFFGIAFLINSIVLLIDIKRRIDFDKENIKQLENKTIDKIISEDTIRDIFGRTSTYIHRIDRYGNEVFETRNEDLTTWVLILMMGLMFIIISIMSTIFEKGTIDIESIILLIIGVIFFKVSQKNVKRIKKMSIKLTTFQYVEFLFMILLFVLVFVPMLTIVFDNNKLFIETLNLEKIFIKLFILTFIAGGVAFLYQIILIIIEILKKHNIF